MTSGGGTNGNTNHHHYKDDDSCTRRRSENHLLNSGSSNNNHHNHSATDNYPDKYNTTTATNNHHHHTTSGGLVIIVRTNKLYYFGIFCLAGILASIVRRRYGGSSYNWMVVPYTNNANRMIDPIIMNEQPDLIPKDDMKKRTSSLSSSLLVRSIVASTAQSTCTIDNAELTEQQEQSSSLSLKSNCTIDFIKKTDPKPLALCYFVPYGKNFGDELGPAVVQKLVENYYPTNCQHNYTILNLAIQHHRERNRPNYRCLFTLGSILHFVKPNDSIWGTGCNPFRQRIEVNNSVVPNITVYATRGPKTWNEYFIKTFPTQSMITTPPPTTSTKFVSATNYGDPGFLIPYLYPQYQKRKNDDTSTIMNNTTKTTIYCVIPHVQDLKIPMIQNITKLYSKKRRKIVVISPYNKWEVVVPQIQTCEYVISSSLHGLIIADAMGIPNLWFQFPGLATARTEGLFKYQDYYNSLLHIINNSNDKQQEEHEKEDENTQQTDDDYQIIRNELENRRPVPNLQSILNKSIYSSPLPEALRWKYVHNLIESFPYHLFERECHSTMTT